MVRPATIHAAILAEHGNTDEQYPHPLTCSVCQARPRKPVTTDMMFWNTGELWYVTTNDPLPDGWVTRTNEQYGFKSTLCPACVEREKHGDE